MNASAGLREGPPGEAGLDPRRVQRARDLLHAHVDGGHTPTLVALVARRGVMVVKEAIGTRGPGLGPVELDSMFMVASTSKPVTATLVMMLAEDGLLGINRPAADYLPELAAGDNARVLVHHLLTHTSGFADDALAELTSERDNKGELTPVPEGVHPWVHRDLSTRWDAPRSKDVGREMIYADHNYNLLGEIVRRVSGQPIDAFARHRLFEPIGMNGSAYVLGEHHRDRLVHRAPDLPCGSPTDGFEHPEYATYDSGADGLKTSAPDLAIFGQMFLNGGVYHGARVLSQAAVTAMTRNQIPGIPTEFGGWHAEAGYGYGWFVDTPHRWAYFHGSLQPLGTVSHPGAGGTSFWIDPVNEIIGVVLEVLTAVSEQGGPASHIFDCFENVVYSAIEEQPASPGTHPSPATGRSASSPSSGGVASAVVSQVAEISTTGPTGVL